MKERDNGCLILLALALVAIVAFPPVREISLEYPVNGYGNRIPNSRPFEVEGGVSLQPAWDYKGRIQVAQIVLEIFGATVLFGMMWLFSTKATDAAGRGQSASPAAPLDSPCPPGAQSHIPATPARSTIG